MSLSTPSPTFDARESGRVVASVLLAAGGNLALALGVFFCALICLPSLHVFSCLSGATQSLKETWGALLMGVALTGLLLVGFAPIGWIFSRATTSVVRCPSRRRPTPGRCNRSAS